MNHGEKTKKAENKFQIKIKSKIHPDVYHIIHVDLNCYEQMPKKKTKSFQRCGFELL